MTNFINSTKSQDMEENTKGSENFQQLVASLLLSVVSEIFFVQTVWGRYFILNLLVLRWLLIATKYE